MMLSMCSDGNITSMSCSIRGHPLHPWAAKKTNAQSYYSNTFDNNSQGDWLFENNGANITGTVEGGSLKLVGGAKANSGFAYWAIVFQPQEEIPIGSRLVLRVKVKTEAVDGPGVYVVLRGDTDQPSAFFQSTQNKITINGSVDFTGHTVAQPYYPAAIKTLQVYFILDGKSSGTVEFDDVELVVLQ